MDAQKRRTTVPDVAHPEDHSFFDGCSAVGVEMALESKDTEKSVLRGENSFSGLYQPEITERIQSSL